MIGPGGGKNSTWNVPFVGVISERTSPFTAVLALLLFDRTQWGGRTNTTSVGATPTLVETVNIG